MIGVGFFFLVCLFGFVWCAFFSGLNICLLSL